MKCLECSARPAEVGGAFVKLRKDADPVDRNRVVFAPGDRNRHMFEQAFKNVDDVLWKEAGCTTELDYIEQTSWILFLKYLDDLEHEKAVGAELAGKPY